MSERYVLNVNNLWKIANSSNIRARQQTDASISDSDINKMHYFRASQATGQQARFNQQFTLPSQNGLPRNYDYRISKMEYEIERENVAAEEQTLAPQQIKENIETKMEISTRNDIIERMNKIVQLILTLINEPQIATTKMYSLFREYNDFSQYYNSYVSEISNDVAFRNQFIEKVIQLQGYFNTLLTEVQTYVNAGYTTGKNLKVIDMGKIEIILVDIMKTFDLMLEVKPTTPFINNTTNLSYGQTNSRNINVPIRESSSGVMNTVLPDAVRPTVRFDTLALPMDTPFATPATRRAYDTPGTAFTDDIGDFQDAAQIPTPAYNPNRTRAPVQLFDDETEARILESLQRDVPDDGKLEDDVRRGEDGHVDPVEDLSPENEKDCIDTYVRFLTGEIPEDLVIQVFNTYYLSQDDRRLIIARATHIFDELPKKKLDDVGLNGQEKPVINDISELTMDQLNDCKNAIDRYKHGELNEDEVGEIFDKYNLSDEVVQVIEKLVYDEENERKVKKENVSVKLERIDQDVVDEKVDEIVESVRNPEDESHVIEDLLSEGFSEVEVKDLLELAHIKLEEPVVDSVIVKEEAKIEDELPVIHTHDDIGERKKAFYIAAREYYSMLENSHTRGEKFQLTKEFSDSLPSYELSKEDIKSVEKDVKEDMKRLQAFLPKIEYDEIEGTNELKNSASRLSKDMLQYMAGISALQKSNGSAKDFEALSSGLDLKVRQSELEQGVVHLMFKEAEHQFKDKHDVRGPIYESLHDYLQTYEYYYEHKDTDPDMKPLDLKDYLRYLHDVKGFHSGKVNYALQTYLFPEMDKINTINGHKMSKEYKETRISILTADYRKENLKNIKEKKPLVASAELVARLSEFMDADKAVNIVGIADKMIPGKGTIPIQEREEGKALEKKDVEIMTAYVEENFTALYRYWQNKKGYHKKTKKKDGIIAGKAIILMEELKITEAEYNEIFDVVKREKGRVEIEHVGDVPMRRENYDLEKSFELPRSAEEVPLSNVPVEVSGKQAKRNPNIYDIGVYPTVYTNYLKGISSRTKPAQNDLTVNKLAFLLNDPKRIAYYTANYQSVEANERVNPITLVSEDMISFIAHQLGDTVNKDFVSKTRKDSGFSKK